MSVGAGSIKRAAGTVDDKKAATKSTTKTSPKKAPAKKTVAKTATKKVAPKKSSPVKESLPISNSTAGRNYGLGEELPIFLM